MSQKVVLVNLLDLLNDLHINRKSAQLFELGYRKVNGSNDNHSVYLNEECKSVVVCILGLDIQHEEILNEIFNICNIFHLEKNLNNILSFITYLIKRIEEGQKFINNTITLYKDYKLVFLGNCLGGYIINKFLPDTYTGYTYNSSFNYYHKNKKIINFRTWADIFCLDTLFKDNVKIDLEFLNRLIKHKFTDLSKLNCMDDFEDKFIAIEITTTDKEKLKYIPSRKLQTPSSENKIKLSESSNSFLKSSKYTPKTPGVSFTKPSNNSSSISPIFNLLNINASESTTYASESTTYASESTTYASESTTYASESTTYASESTTYASESTDQNYPLLNNEPIKGFFYWQSNYATSSYNPADGTMTNANQWFVNNTTAAQDLTTAKQYIEENVNPSAPLSATHMEPYSTDPSITQPTGSAKVFDYPVKQYTYTETNPDSSLIPIPDGTNCIALFTGYSHAGLSLQNFYAYEPYYIYNGGTEQNNILKQSLSYLKANYANSTNYLLGFSVGGGWNYTGSWNTVVTNSYPKNGSASSSIYAQSTISNTYPITKTYNTNQPASSISGVLQLEGPNSQGNPLYTYVKPFQMTAESQTSFYLNDSNDPNNGGSYNAAYQWFAPNDLGVGGVYSCYQYITPKGKAFSYVEESTGYTQSGVGLGGIVYSDDPKSQEPKYINVNDTGYYKFDYETTPLQVNCIFFDIETWGKLCWPYPNGKYAYPNPTDPNSNYIWSEIQKLTIPNGVDVYDFDNNLLPACYSSAKDFLTLFQWIKTQYPSMKIILTTPHSCGNFSDARNKVSVGAKEFVPLYEGGTFYNESTASDQNCYDILSPQNYTCNLGTTNEYAANPNLPWTITDENDTNTDSFQTAILKNEQYKKFGLNFIVPAVNYGNFGKNASSYDCYDKGGTNDGNPSNLYYFLADYNDQTNNSTGTTSFPSYYQGVNGSNTVPYDTDKGTREFYKQIMSYNGETIPYPENTGGGCMQWVNGDLNTV